MNSLIAKRKILIVDVDEREYFITSEYLKVIPGNRFLIDWSCDYEDAKKKCINNEYDLYFVDWELGAKTGLDLVKEAINLGCESPIILLTDKNNPDDEVNAIRYGAYDFLIRFELSTEKLERCIRYSLSRANAIKELQENEKKYRSIFENAKDVLLIADVEYKIVDINYAATDILEYDLEELINTDFTLLFFEESSKDFFIKVLEESGEIFDFEVDIMSKNTVVKSCIVSASIELKNNGSEYIQAVIRDNTLKKRAEKTIMAAEKLAATGRLVRILAHEVRNPLNNILLSADQLISENKDADSLVYLEIVQRNCKRIGDLISELLNSSNISSNVELSRCSIQEVTDATIVNAIDRIALKKIELKVSYPDFQCYALLDEKKIKLILLNIIINAIEAMKEGEGKLEINLKSSNVEYAIEIKDNGEGISEENIPNLFQPDFTLKRSGLGLGLSTALAIIQSHNGHIEVKSELGKGTSFFISFLKAL